MNVLIITPVITLVIVMPTTMLHIKYTHTERHIVATCI